MLALIGLVDKNKIIEIFGKDLKCTNLKMFKYNFCPFEDTFISCKDYGYVIKSDVYEFEKGYIMLCNDGTVITDKVYSPCNRRLIGILKNELVLTGKLSSEVFENQLKLNLGESYNICKDELSKRYRYNLTRLNSVLNNEELTK